MKNCGHRLIAASRQLIAASHQLIAASLTPELEDGGECHAGMVANVFANDLCSV
jgi:hypothetical protein